MFFFAGALGVYRKKTGAGATGTFAYYAICMLIVLIRVVRSAWNSRPVKLSKNYRVFTVTRRKVFS